jgi:NADP-dependent 3-hydroxy acid dehydrogenase YdfG
VSRNAGQQIIVIPGASRGTGREAAHVFAGGRADGVLAARSCATLGSLPQCLATPKGLPIINTLSWSG